MRALLALGTACCLTFPAPAADRCGAPLPAGALLRLGTLRNRAPISSFGIEKDCSIVTAGPTGELHRWKPNRDQPETLVVLPGLEDNGLGDQAQVSPDGRLVAARVKHRVVVWEVPADARTKPREVAGFDILGAKRFAFSPDGGQLLVATGGELWESVSRPHSIHLCALGTGKTSNLEEAAGHVSQVSFSGNGKRAVALTDGCCLFWEAQTGKKVGEVKLKGHWFDACALNPTGDLLVAQPRRLNRKFEWRFFDALTGIQRDDLKSPEGGTWATFAPDGKTLLVGGQDGIQWWDPAAGKLLRRFEADVGRVPARFSPDGKVLVASSGHVLFMWDAASGKELFPDQNIGHVEAVTALGVSPDGKRIATRGWEGRLCVWDAETGKELWRAPAEVWTFSRVDFSPDSRFLYVGVPKRSEVLKLDATTGKEARTFVGDAAKPKWGSVEVIRVAADGKTVSALIGPSEVLQYAQLIAWDADSGERLATRPIYDKTCPRFDLSPDGAFIAGSGDLAMVMPVAEQGVNYLKAANLRSLGAPAFSDDGQWLTLIASANAPDGQRRHWAVVVSTKTWKEVCSVTVGEDGRAALSPDGKTLAVAYGEKLSFYDAATTNLVGEFKLPAAAWKGVIGGYTHVLRFMPDGKKLITGHADTTALVWPVPRPSK